MPETALSPRLEKALAGRGVRVGAQVLNAVPMLLLAGAEVFLFYTGKDATGYRVGIVEILLGVCALAVVVMQLVLVLRRAQTIGSSLLRFDYRDPETARPRGGRLFCQLLLTSLLTTVTVGVMAIVLLVTYRRGQSMVDRWLGLVATRPKDIPEEPRPKLNAAPVGRVRQVTMPGMATAAPVSQQPPDPPGMQPLPPQQGAATPPPGIPSSWVAAGPVSPPHAAGASPAAPMPASRPVSPVTSASAGALIERSPFAPKDAVPTPATILREGSAAVPLVSVSQPLHTPASSQETVSETRTTGRDETMLDKVAVSAEPKLCLDDGTVLSLDTPLVFGRNPVALPEYPESQPHELIDETMKMSKVHAVVLADDGDVHVVDVGARNGVIFEFEGTRWRIEQHLRTPVRPGTVVYLGGRSFQVES